MATTTPNFGWSVPTSTDLVKDGATAIETLGDAIDASLLDLKGGTTGQILAKNSNTDMDFTWTASSGTTWTAYTPTYSNITVGNGTVSARYAKSGKFVFVTWTFTLGSTSSYGNSPRVSLPSTAASTNFVDMTYALDGGTNEMNGLTFMPSTTQMTFYVNISGYYGISPSSATVPWTWGNTDKIIMNLTYEEA